MCCSTTRPGGGGDNEGVEIFAKLRGLEVVVPLLDLVEALEERDRDEDDDCLLAVADLDL